jgi:hypothetical protein
MPIHFQLEKGPGFLLAIVKHQFFFNLDKPLLFYLYGTLLHPIKKTLFFF